MVIQKIAEEKSGRRSEAVVVKVLKRANEMVVGVFEKSKNYGFVVPDNQKIARDIFIDKQNTMGAVNGHKVVVQVLDFGNSRKKSGRKGCGNSRPCQ